MGRQGPLSQPWVYDNSNSIELAGPGLWDLLLVCVCLFVRVSESVF